ncbi:hypothetical protein RFI_25859 [Reticulomyxa filosa]|uniref:Cytochrome P450 n=1 Tax=Reticulomyxa filosa TaxID=46433 RepID=X6MDM0_RETFI|nr:hypothetical protein RFI_25859 [Reticulomyxa filosa]|eukprot:ETO11517.1 hypothetical protein RFI_25859 [Reticulomyxa filosa]
MIIAGRDTTRTLLSWFLYAIYDKPDIKAKIMQEINNMVFFFFFNLLSPLCGVMEYTALLYAKKKKKRLKYLEAVLLETLRLFPPVPILARMAKKDVELPGGKDEKKYTIREGNMVMIHVWSQARNPKYFEDPSKFDPMRWYEQGVAAFPPHMFPQFNIAPRLCLGRTFALLEAKIFACHFLKTFDYTPVDTEEPRVEGGPILNMTDGYRVHLTPLKQA